MRVLIALCLVLVCGTHAFPSFQRSAAAARSSSGSSGSSSLPPFVPAGPGDLRSPCPILNTLANHGILPHNGRDITEEKLSSAFIKFLGTTKAFGEGFAKIAFAKFIKYKKTVDPAATTITLGDLALPFEKDGIAHNASLSRPDAPTTVDPQHYVVPKPDAARVDSELAKVNKRGKDILTMADLSAIRKFVKTLSAPKAAPLVHEFIGAAEICLLMNAGYGKTGLTADWYRTFLVEEKFPADFHISERLMGFGFINVGRCVLGIEARTAYLTIKDQIRKIPYFGVPHQ